MAAIVWLCSRIGILGRYGFPQYVQAVLAALAAIARLGPWEAPL
jgi:hypothetical protein